MEPTADLRASLRTKIGEPQNADESIFTTEETDAMLRGSNNILEATILGWEAKVAHFSGLVDVTDGAASRKLGMLYENAMEMLKYYQNKAARGPLSTARVRARVGKIIRHG